jgi:hypothetical protein
VITTALAATRSEKSSARRAYSRKPSAMPLEIVAGAATFAARAVMHQLLVAVWGMLAEQLQPFNAGHEHRRLTGAAEAG